MKLTRIQTKYCLLFHSNVLIHWSGWLTSLGLKVVVRNTIFFQHHLFSIWILQLIVYFWLWHLFMALFFGHLFVQKVIQLSVLLSFVIYLAYSDSWLDKLYLILGWLFLCTILLDRLQWTIDLLCMFFPNRISKFSSATHHNRPLLFLLFLL